MFDQNEIKEKYYLSLQEIKSELDACGIVLEKNDLSNTSWNILNYLRNSKFEDENTKKLADFFHDNKQIIGDLIASHPKMIDENPFKITLSFENRDILIYRIPKDAYYMEKGMSGLISNIIESIFGSIIPYHIYVLYMTGTLEEQIEVKNFLYSWMDFNNSRNYYILYAKLKWVKIAFPDMYEKMMKSGEFLSIEELQDKVKEQDLIQKP